MSATPPPLNAPRGPAPAPGSWTAIQVNSHLHTLKILFYVMGSIQVCAAFLLLMVAMAGYSAESNSPNPMAQPMVLLVILITAGLVFGATAVISFMAAQALGLRQRHRLCMVAAGAACLSGALGIALGVYAFIVLLRSEVQTAFAAPGSTVVA